MNGQLTTFTLAAHSYGLPVQAVQEVLKEHVSTPVPLTGDDVRGLMNLRGEIVLVLDLRARLSMPERSTGPPPMGVVVRVDDEPICLLVDRINDVINVTEDMFEASPDNLDGPNYELIRGAYKLPDRLVLALDVERAVTEAR